MNTNPVTSLKPHFIRPFFRPLGFAAACLLGVSAHGDIVGPYAPDANTPFLFHFDEPAGSSAAANSGVFTNTNAGNAISYNQNTFPGGSGGTNPGVAAGATGILGAPAYSGFGNAANVNPANATAATANGNGLAFDFDNNGTFAISRSTTGTSDYLPLTNIADSTTKAFTLEAMIKTSSVLAAASPIQEIISTDSTNANAGRGFQFRLNALGRLEFTDVGATTSTASFSAASSISVTDLSLGANTYNSTDWFHAAVTYDGSTVRFYWTKVDPVNLSASLLGSTFNLPSAELDLTDSGPLVFGNEGRYAATGAAFSNEGLLGSIDEVRISTIARSSSQFIFAVPEPGSAMLLLCGFATFLGLRRRD